MSRRNANIVSLTKAEKTAIASALRNQIKLLTDEPPSSNPVVNRLVDEQIQTLTRAIEKMEA